MTLVDWIIAAILAGAVVIGFVQGFFRSAFALGGLLLGLVLAAWNYGRGAALVMPFVHTEQMANVIGFLLIALLVACVAGGAGILLAKAMHYMGLGCLDRLVGAAFGLFQGALLVTLCILVTVAFFPQTRWLTESRLPRYFFGVCNLSTHISPDELANRVRHELRTLEDSAPEWMHPGRGGA
jgi:membrane protein required for colicin V production